MNTHKSARLSIISAMRPPIWNRGRVVLRYSAICLFLHFVVFCFSIVTTSAYELTLRQCEDFSLDVNTRISACTDVIRNNNDNNYLFRALISRSIANDQLTSGNSDDNLSVSLRDLSQALDLGIDNALVYGEMSRLYVRHGLFQASLDILGMAIDQYPRNYELIVSRGAVWLSIALAKRINSQEVANALDAAQADFDRAIDIDPKNPKGFKFRASVEFNLGRMDKALESLSTALVLDPNDLSALYQRGLLQELVGRCVSAIDDYSRIIEVDDRASMAFFHRGNCRLRAKEFESAASDYRRALALDPGNAEIIRQLELALKLRDAGKL